MSTKPNDLQRRNLTSHVSNRDLGPVPHRHIGFRRRRFKEDSRACERCLLRAFRSQRHSPARRRVRVDVNSPQSRSGSTRSFRPRGAAGSRHSRLVVRCSFWHEVGHTQGLHLSQLKADASVGPPAKGRSSRRPQPEHASTSARARPVGRPQSPQGSPATCSTTT